MSVWTVVTWIELFTSEVLCWTEVPQTESSPAISLCEIIIFAQW